MHSSRQVYYQSIDKVVTHLVEERRPFTGHIADHRTLCGTSYAFRRSRL